MQHRSAATARNRAGQSRNRSDEPSIAPGPNWNVLPAPRIMLQDAFPQNVKIDIEQRQASQLEVG